MPSLTLKVSALSPTFQSFNVLPSNRDIHPSLAEKLNDVKMNRLVTATQNNAYLKFFMGCYLMFKVNTKNIISALLIQSAPARRFTIYQHYILQTRSGWTMA